MRNPTLRTALAVVCVVVITVCGILVLGRLVGRTRVADLTAEDVYTLSEGTRNILGKLNQSVDLKLYYARTAARKGPEGVRFWNNYFLYVRDVLNEFVDRSKGKLTLEVIDPRPYTEEEDEAVRYGVKRFQMTEDEPFFFGMVATTELGKDETIEFFNPDRQEFVEYDVAKLLVSLMQQEKKKIGVIANVPILGTDMSPYMMQMMRAQGRQPERPWTIVGHLESNYEVEKVEIEEADPKVPEDVDFLMVVHPKSLDEKTRFAIDQYVMRGGKLVVFVDPHCLHDQPMMRQPQMMMQHEAASSLNDLLENWGVRMEEGQIACDRKLALTIPPGRNASPVAQPQFFELRDPQMSDQEVITANLHSVRMCYPGALTTLAGTGTEIRPLLHTSSVGTTWELKDAFQIKFNPFDPEPIVEAISDGTEPVMLACMITGKFKTNFPGGFEVEVEEPEEPDDEESSSDEEAGDEGDAGPQGEAPKPATDQPAATKPTTDKPTTAQPAEKGEPAGEGEEKEEEPEEPEKKTKTIQPVTEAAEGATVVVVADVDMIANSFAYRESFFGMEVVGDNAAFVLNTLDYLSGSEDLIRVRSRGGYDRPFKVVEAIEEEADKATKAKVKELNDKIEKFDEEIKKLAGTRTDENVQVIQSQAMEKWRTLQEQRRQARKELRRLQAGRREKVEDLELRLKLLNLTVAPGLILLIAIGLSLARWFQARQYAARRT